MGDRREIRRVPEYKDVAESILSVSPTKSGVIFSIAPEKTISLMLTPPPRHVTLSDEEIFSWYMSQQIPLDGSVLEIGSEGEYEEILSKARKRKANEFTGGHGITTRTLTQIEKHLPSTTVKLQTETGKIAFLGNGLSPVPLLLAERFTRKEIKSPPIVVDMYDYGLLEEDLSSLAVEFTGRGLELPVGLVGWTETTRKLNQESRRGSLQLMQHYFGEGTPAQGPLSDIALAVNCWGPEENSLHEQLAVLEAGGELLILFATQEYAGFVRKSLRTPDGRGRHGVSYIREV